jgi:hypothetical protein
LAPILVRVDLVTQQTRLAGARDTAVRNLRDLTIAIAITASAGVGLAAWVSAATIPGSTGTPTSNPGSTSGTTAPAVASTDEGFGQPAPVSSQIGSAVAVTGGSR